MDIVGQIKAAFEAGAKFLWGIFLAAIVATYLYHLRPEWFFGLPQWAMPVVRLVATIFGVFALVSAVEPICSSLKKLGRFLLTPFRKRRIRRELLRVGISELFFICIARTSQNRSFPAKPDSEHILALERKGLIENGGAKVGHESGGIISSAGGVKSGHLSSFCNERRRDRGFTPWIFI
nr:hypothetical protein [Marinicella sp. W31]MDC2877044.1 hypothetical protein [Marinicella sp. W31]